MANEPNWRAARCEGTYELIGFAFSDWRIIGGDGRNTSERPHDMDDYLEPPHGPYAIHTLNERGEWDVLVEGISDYQRAVFIANCLNLTAELADPGLDVRVRQVERARVLAQRKMAEV